MVSISACVSPPASPVLFLEVKELVSEVAQSC